MFLSCSLRVVLLCLPSSPPPSPPSSCAMGRVMTSWFVSAFPLKTVSLSKSCSLAVLLRSKSEGSIERDLNPGPIYFSLPSANYFFFILRALTPYEYLVV